MTRPHAAPPVRTRRGWIAALTLAALAGRASAAGPPQSIDFNRDIRPILSENCFSCHGQDASHRKAELRLDVREAAVASGAIVPGDVEASTLIERVTSEEPSERMPPPKSR